MKQGFLVNSAGVFQTYIYVNNRKAAVTSAHLTVYMPGISTKLIDDAPMTIGPDGLLSYNLSPVENGTPGADYKAVIRYVYGSGTFYLTLFYDVVRSVLAKVISDEDIISELPQLKENGWKVSGKAESGTASAITDQDLKRYGEDYFTGGLAYSAAKDETREITGFSALTGTATTAAFTSAVTTGEPYVLTRPFSSEIQRAFEKMEDGLARLGKRPDLVLDPYDLREVHIYYSVAEACKGLLTSKDNVWWDLWKDYEKKAQDALGAAVLKYDATGDGFISPAEAGSSADVLRSGRG